jgi:tight adherence protein B
MSPVLVFIVLLIPSFALLVWLLRPTATEKSVNEHLTNIERGRISGTGGASIIKKDQTSPAPWLDEFVAQLPGGASLSNLIHQSGSTWSAGIVFVSVILLAAIAGWIASLITDVVIIPLGVAVGAGAIPLIYLSVRRAIRFRRFDSQLPEAVDLMARGLRAGHAVSAVLEMVGKELGEPLAAEFRTLHEEQTLGLPLRDAMLNLVERVPRDDLRFLATAILLQKETGGNLVQILDKTAALLRERARLRGQLNIYTAQGRITGWILCGAPFLLFVVLGVVNPDYEKLLFSEPLGNYMVYAGITMMTLGILIIRKIIDVKV